MGGEQGQASVEWTGIVLLVALALAGLTHLAPRADGRSLASTLLDTVAHPEVAATRSGRRNDPLPPARGGFTAPPPLPFPRPWEAPAKTARPSARPLLRWLGQRAAGALAGAVPRRAGGLRGAVGVAWRRAWLGCLAYERFRYAFLHPESRFPGQTIPSSELLRIANDCISPVDLVRDWPLLRDR
jgi:hypothetical protein